jgi:hypothetical protein
LLKQEARGTSKGRRKQETGRRKEEGRRKKEEGRRKKEEIRKQEYFFNLARSYSPFPTLKLSNSQTPSISPSPTLPIPDSTLSFQLGIL